MDLYNKDTWWINWHMLLTISIVMFVAFKCTIKNLTLHIFKKCCILLGKFTKHRYNLAFLYYYKANCKFILNFYCQLVIMYQILSLQHQRAKSFRITKATLTNGCGRGKFGQITFQCEKASVPWCINFLRKFLLPSRRKRNCIRADVCKIH